MRLLPRILLAALPPVVSTVLSLVAGILFWPWSLGIGLLLGSAAGLMAALIWEATR